MSKMAIRDGQETVHGGPQYDCKIYVGATFPHRQ